MTARERWVRTLHFQSVDHVPDEEFGYRDDTPTRWHKEGLPREVDSNDKADRYFDFDRRARVSGDIGLRPPFEAPVIEETEDRRTIMDGPGGTYIQPKDGHSTIPHYLDFPIKTRDEWQRFEERLDPADPGRLPRNLPEIKAQWERRDVPLGTSIGSLFGWLRNWTGFEGISIACAEDGPTYQEALANVEAIAQEWIETAKELGRPVPEPKGRLVFA